MQQRPRSYFRMASISSVFLALLFSGILAGSQTPGSSPSEAAAKAASPASALGVYVYPKNQQDRAQQQRDENECYGWSKQQTGIDPAAPPPASSSQQPSQSPKGGAVKGAARGAAAGSAVGAVAGDAGEGAAVGATAGAIRGRRAQKKAEKQAEKQAKEGAKAAKEQTMATFRKAFSACMDARQYSVR